MDYKFMLSLALALAALAAALGTSTPGSRLNKDEITLSDHAQRLDKLEQKVDDIDDGVKETIRLLRQHR